MKVIHVWLRVASTRHGRVWRLVTTAVMAALLATCWWASSAAATVIKVNTLKETAVFDPPGPVYSSKIVGDSGSEGECSLREAIRAANTHHPVKGCPAGDGNDTIELMHGTYHILDNFFIRQKMTFLGPNKGLAGNDPNRGPEALLSFDFNPNWSAQVAMFWLDQPSDTGDAKGAGTVFDGVAMQGGFAPDCHLSAPCEIVAIVQPSKIVQQGYTLTNSIVRHFSFGLYLGGTDTITRDLFEDNNQVPDSSAHGFDIYSDFVYTAHDTVVDDNVFKNPFLSGVILQGDGNRGTVVGGQIEHNLFLKEVDHDLGAFLVNTSGVVVKDNLFYHPNPPPLPGRGDSAIRLDQVNDIQITGNTITGWGAGISIGSVGAPGEPGSTDVTAAFNRIYNNRWGVKVTPSVFGTTQYQPLQVNANDNWWGSNGGPGSVGARPGAINPVNGVQFLESDSATPVADQGGITVDRWLQLTCSVPPSVEVNVPAAVVGQIVGMPTVDVASSTPPWFIDHAEPLMAASAPGLGSVFGFDRVPDQGPNNAQLTGTLLATATGTGDVLVDLDSERVACPLTVTPGPDVVVDKSADSPTVMAGGLAGYRITVTNRGSVTARNWWVCDRIPRRMTFVRAIRKLRRLGRLRCLVIPRLRPHHRLSFHLTLRVASDAPSTTVDNIADVTPGPPIGPPDVPPTGKAGAKVKVRPPVRRPPAPPVTG